MSEDPHADPLARLGAEIDEARRERFRQQASGRAAAPQGSLGLGLRIATELVEALCVGSAFGWVAYRFLPAPWGAIGLIVFFFLGAAAGMVNVFRAAKGVGKGSVQPSAGQRERPRDS
jgi:ATP synthase protein I